MGNVNVQNTVDEPPKLVQFLHRFFFLTLHLVFR